MYGGKKKTPFKNAALSRSLAHRSLLSFYAQKNLRGLGRCAYPDEKEEKEMN